MDRIWQWAWNRYGAKYSWAIWAIMFAPALLTYVAASFLVVAFEKSHHYVEATIVAGAAVVVFAYVLILPDGRGLRLAQRWASGEKVDRQGALKDTYTWASGLRTRSLTFQPVWSAILLTAVGLIAGADGSRLIQYGVLGAAIGISMTLIGLHTFAQGALRPVRGALAGDTGIGDALPRSRPTFATWLELSMMGCMFTYAVAGAMLAVVV